MKTVVLGAAGLLGRYVVDELGRARAGEVIALGHRECDITRADQVRACTAGAEVIVNCAAFTNVDSAEADEEGAHRINALGAENVARAAAQVGARLVHISTDFVFDGAQAQPYDESAAPNPQSAYARSKLAGEERVARVLDERFLVRVQGLYGDGGANFSSKLRALVLAQKPLTLDGERRVQPTWARAAARQLVKIAATRAYGLYHVSCKGETTWAGFSERLAERLGVGKSWRVVGSAELGAPAKRPPNCLFDHRALAQSGLDVMPTWQAAQDEYLAEAGGTR